MVLQLFSSSSSDFEATLIEVFGLEMGKYQPSVSIEKMRGLAYTFPIHLVTPFLYKTGLAPCELLTSSFHFLTSLLSLCPEVFRWPYMLESLDFLGRAPGSVLSASGVWWQSCFPGGGRRGELLTVQWFTDGQVWPREEKLCVTSCTQTPCKASTEPSDHFHSRQPSSSFFVS